MVRILALLALLSVSVAALHAQTNLALSATASTSGGGTGNPGYGPHHLNDTVINQNPTSQQNFSWVTAGTQSANTAFWQLTWSSSVTVASFTFFPNEATTRFLSGADVQYWNGSAWVTDHRYSVSPAMNYTVNLTAPRTTTMFRLYNLFASSGNPTCCELRVFGPSGPSLATSTPTLNLGTTPVGTAGTAVSYMVSGSSLTGNTTITAPAGVNVSLSQTTGFAQSIPITTFPTYSNTLVWARLTGASAGAVTGNITHQATGATTVNVAVNGTVTGPTVSATPPTINLGSTPVGTPGAAINYSVSGSALTGPTTITAPAGVEVSLSMTTGYAGSIQITTTPAYTNTTVWARLTGAAAIIVSGNITHAATGATTVNVTPSGNTWSYTATPASLNLGATSVGTPSSAQSYDLAGAGLIANTVINAPTGFELSTTQAGTYTASLNINQMPTLTQTVWVRLTGAALGTFNGNVTNVAGSASVNVPVDGSVTPPNNLTISRNGPGATTLVDNDAQGAGNNGLVILDVTLSTAQAAWTVTDLTFTASGTADEQAGLNFLALYEDINTNGTFDGPTTDTLATAAAGTSFNGANGTYLATLTNTAWAVTTTRRFFLVCKLAGTALAGQTIHAELTTATGTTGSGGTVTGAPTSAGNDALTINAATLAATLIGPMAFTTVNNTSQGPSSNGHVVCEFTLAARNDSWTVTSLTFTESGSMDGLADLNFLALYLDNGNGTWDGPGTDLLATAAAGTGFSAANGTYTATLAGGAGTFTVNQSKRFYLAAKLAGTASPGEQLRVALTGVAQTSPTGGTVTGTPTAASSALQIDVPVLTVNAGPANPGLVTREQGAAGFQVMVGQYRFTASNADFVIPGFTLSTSGGGNWTANLDAATGVQVYRDNGNGTFEVTDTLIFSGAGGTPSVSCNFTANQTFTMNTDADLWIVYNVLATAGASPAEIFDSGISAAGDIQAVTGGGTITLGTVPPTSATLRVVTYALTSITPTASLPAGGAPITITGSGFATPVTLTIGGINCTGTAVVNAGGTQITGLNVPAGSGQNLAIVLTTNNLGAKTLTQTFSYSNVVVIGGSGGGGGGGGGGGCAAHIAAAPTAMLVPLMIALWRRRREREA